MATTTGIQQGDVALTQTLDGGDFCVEGGIVAMCPGLEVSVYVAMFGGNPRDTGAEGDPLQYWGNFIETDPSEVIRSRTQHVVQSMPLSPSNLRRLEEAAKLDLEYLLVEKIANSVEVAATVPGVDKVHITVTIDAFGTLHQFNFTENWKASL